MKRILSNNKGMALATVIIIFAVVAVLGTVVLTISTAQVRGSLKSEKTTKAYYYARSAVEVISSDIEKKFGELKQLYDNIADSDTVEEAEQNQEIYDDAVTAFNDLRLVPLTASDTCGVQVEGILPQPLTVTVTNNNYIPATGKYEVIVSCAVTYQGGTSSARARIGTFEQDSTDLTYTTTENYDTADLGDDMMYSWGNVVIQGSNITMDHGKKIGAQGKVTNKKGDTLTGDYLYGTPIPREMPILVPPTEDPDALAYQTKQAVSLAGTQDLGPSDNGWYTSIGGPGKNEGVSLTWNVDTSAEDVVLVFDGFYTANQTKINVTGPNKLIIYVKEPYNGSLNPQPLINLSNQTVITSGDPTDPVNPPNYDNPLTYFVTYNDVLQLYRAGHDNTTLLSSEEAKKLSTGVYGALDTVKVPNLSDIAAFFYLPGSSFYTENNTDAYGATYASYIDVQGNKDFHYKKAFDFADLFSSAGQDITRTIVDTLTVNYYNTEYGRVWMR